MSEPDKYRLKARELIALHLTPFAPHSDWPEGGCYLEPAITEALAEAAREGMERAAEIAKKFPQNMSNPSYWRLCEGVAEAILKEAACEKS